MQKQQPQKDKIIEKVQEEQSIENQDENQNESDVFEEIPLTSEKDREDYNKQIELMYDQHRMLQKAIQEKVDLPYKLYGWVDAPEQKPAFMGEQIFTQSRIPKPYVCNHLYKIFNGTLLSMCNLDQEFLQEYCENNFAQRLIKNLQQYKEQGYRVEVYNDVSGIQGEVEFLDMVLVRGLDVDRSLNLSRKDYHQFKDIDDMGIVIYTPLTITDPLNFIDPKKNKTMYDPYKKMIMRILAYIKTPLRMKIFEPNGNQIQIDDSMYTWEHIAIFETQMIPPEKFKSSYKLENYQEWITKFQLGTWKLVDLDNWMKGNPLILKDSERNLYKDEIFKKTKFDPEYSINLRNV